MIRLLPAGLLLLTLAACSRPATVEVAPSPRFDDREVTLASYADSATLLTARAGAGLRLDCSAIPGLRMPLLAQLMADGRTRAVLVLEPGDARVDSGAYSAVGTPLNDRLTSLMRQADSIEEHGSEQAYVEFVARAYADNRDTPVGEYFATELSRSLDLDSLDRMLAAAPDNVRRSPRVQRYRAAARLRKATGPGAMFTDFAGRDAAGAPLSLGAFAAKGKWLLVDFWASWCPYCIKELPALKEIYADYAPRGLEIVGVAVRDTPADTRAAVGRHGIPWPVIYDTARVPYDIYGFTGIPHLMLLDPRGRIVSRGESPAAIAGRLKKALRH